MKALIFDFDGTIADTFHFFAHFLAEKARRAPLSDEQLHALRGLSLKATSRRLGHSWLRMPGLYYAGRHWLGQVMDEVEPIDGVLEALQSLKADGYQLYILSSNSPQNIDHFLQKQGLLDVFSGIYGNIFWRGKRSVLRQLLREHNLKARDCLYIGDEVRDVVAAKRARIKSIGVGWGYNSAEELTSRGATYAAKTPAELVQVARTKLQ